MFFKHIICFEKRSGSLCLNMAHFNKMCPTEQKVWQVEVPSCLSEVKAETNSSSCRKGSVTDSSHFKKLTLFILCAKSRFILSIWMNTFYCVQIVFFRKIYLSHILQHAQEFSFSQLCFFTFDNILSPIKFARFKGMPLDFKNSTL